MPISAQQYYARVRAHADSDGRLPVPDLAGWDIFPFERDGLLGKPLAPLTLPEPPRDGESDGPCRRCDDGGRRAAWGNDRWTISPPAEPLGLPFAAILESRAHLDLGDLDDDMAAELGVIVARVTRAVESWESVARLHVNRWGDGGAHLHVWLLGRPAGLLQLRGSCLPVWDDMLPRVPTAEAADGLARVATALAGLEGR